MKHGVEILEVSVAHAVPKTERSVFHAWRSLGMRPRLRIGMASPVEACTMKKVQHIIKNVAMSDILHSQSMRCLL